jgi:hypothetical protein
VVGVQLFDDRGDVAVEQRLGVGQCDANVEVVPVASAICAMVYTGGRGKVCLNPCG